MLTGTKETLGTQKRQSLPPTTNSDLYETFANDASPKRGKKGSRLPKIKQARVSDFEFGCHSSGEKQKSPRTMRMAAQLRMRREVKPLGAHRQHEKSFKTIISAHQHSSRDIIKENKKNVMGNATKSPHSVRSDLYESLRKSKTRRV